MAEKKFTEVIDEINLITNKLKDPNTSIEDAIDDFKKAKLLIEKAEEQLQVIEDEVNMVLDDNKTIKKIEVE